MYQLSVGKLTVFNRFFEIFAKNMAWSKKLFKKKIQNPLKAVGGGSKGLSGLYTKKDNFFAASPCLMADEKCFLKTNCNLYRSFK